MTAHFSSRVTNFEFVKNVRESGFCFKSFKESVDLSRIAHLDLDRVARDLDISVLQEHVGILVNSDLSDLKGVDAGLLKLLRLAQLCVDYCLFCQDFLESSLSALENAHQDALKELDSLRRENKTLKEKLRKDIRKKRFLSEKENLNDQFYECSQCRKAYTSQEFLQSHIQRRHSASEPGEDRFAKEMFEELKSEIESLRKELVREKEESLKNFQDHKTEMQLKREENLWSEIEKSQAEQRARHQAEIADLTANFQLQLKQALADLATNLSKSEGYSSKVTEVPSSQPLINEFEIETLKKEMSEMWQKKQEQQEQWFRLENSKLMEQLTKMQERDEQRWSSLKNLQNKPDPPVVLQTDAAIIPVPATRRKRLQASINAEIKDITPSTPPKEESSESSSSSSSVEEVRPASAPVQSLVVCTPKIIPSRPKSAMAFEEQSVEETFSEEEENSTDPSEDIEATLQDMKEAIEGNPVLIESLKNEVENQIEEKMSEIGLSSAEQSLNRSEFISVNNRMNEQRKQAEKQYRGFWKIRKGIEKKVEKKAKENVSEICVESIVKPSKLKQHPGFFSKLTKRYNKKENKAKSDTQVFTSTPLKDAVEPHSILKPSNLRMSSEALSEKVLDENAAEIRRAHSLPASKFVTFTSSKEETKENNSWDEDTASNKTTEPKEEVRKIGQGSFNPFILSSASGGNQINLDDLEKELGTFQLSPSSFQNKSTPTTKTDLSLPLSDDNSWDLEDI
ncbi:cilium assembly protein DZIP1L isoform X2 [Cloeon dipterum]|uniref:cilium assembly protein DZIP1L isoform X2 n=1 Tax=Cloeon dipterum TaxID=197152 RepID=UPI00321FA9DB